MEPNPCCSTHGQLKKGQHAVTSMKQSRLGMGSGQAQYLMVFTMVFRAATLDARAVRVVRKSMS